MESTEQIRDEVHRRFQVWGWQGASARRYALLVAGYFRTRGPYHVEGEDKYLALPDGMGLRLVEWVEASADRPLTPTEREDAARVVAAVEEEVQRRLLRDATHLFISRFGVFDCLLLALVDPRRAAARLILFPGEVPVGEAWQQPWPPQYPAARQVMECLCPVSWEHTAADWKPPQDAMTWARRIYDERAFTELPILSDMLEEAGCPDRLLLAHCRLEGDHFRGCAAVDRLLGLGRPNHT